MNRIALVITTYNNPRCLGLCLASLGNQTWRDFEIFVADDGSGEETRAKIDAFRARFARGIQHVWHPDTGYEKAKINNEVFRRLRGYPAVICIDHDVVLHHRFVEDHARIHAAHPRAYFMGRRVDLGPGLTAALNEENVCRFNRAPAPVLWWRALRDGADAPFRAVRIGSPRLRKLLKRDRVPDLLGSNFSVSTDLLYEVNGYNEDYKSYWGEDGDLFVRLRNSGATQIGLKNYAVQFHLEHRRLEPNREAQTRYAELVKDRDYRRCRKGIVRDGA